MKNSSNITFTDFSIFWIFFKFLTEKWKTFEKPDFFQIFFLLFRYNDLFGNSGKSKKKNQFSNFLFFRKCRNLKKSN